MITSKEALDVFKEILKEIFADDDKVLEIMMHEEANNETNFIKEKIIEMEMICKLAKDELENDK